MHRLSLPEAIIQANLAIKALLKSLDFLKPRPPTHLGLQILSHDLHARNLPSFSFGFHQSLLVKHPAYHKLFLEYQRLTWHSLGEIEQLMLLRSSFLPMIYTVQLKWDVIDKIYAITSSCGK